MYMDTFFASKKLGPSIRGYSCAQLFAIEFGYVDFCFMKTKGELPLALKTFFKDPGVPDKIICDRSLEQIYGESIRLYQPVECDVQALERGKPWANRAELNIGIFKSQVKKDSKDANSPITLWCYYAERGLKIISSTTRKIYNLQGQVPYSKLTGIECDNSNLSEYGGYKWVYYRDSTTTFPQ